MGLPSRELTLSHQRKGKSSSKLSWEGICSVPWRLSNHILEIPRMFKIPSGNASKVLSGGSLLDGNYGFSGRRGNRCFF